MAKFFNIPVKEIRKETSDTVSVSFQISENTKDQFKYEAGQYLTFKQNIEGEEIRRSYSLCSSPLENEWRVAIKKVPGGKFSTFANEVLAEGALLEIMPPIGNFILKKEIKENGLYVFFAAGSGITPILSIIKTILFSNKSAQVILFYGNKSSDQIIFKEELEGLKNNYINHFSLHHILSQERQEAALFNGRIDAEKCAVFSKVYFNLKEVTQYFICGPEMMIHSVKDFLANKNVLSEKIKFELFSTPTSKAFVSEKKNGHKKAFDPELASLVTIKIDGDMLEFPLAYGGINILDGTIANGGDAPFACKGGVCCTCKALLVKGEVEMDQVFGLEQDEVDAGYILTCQSHPRTQAVTVDYDV